MAQLADWYDRRMASGHRMSSDELALLVARVSGLRTREKMACNDRAAKRRADEPGKFLYGRNHRDFGNIRARQIAAEETRSDGEMPRDTVWTLGSSLWCLQVPKESTRTGSSHAFRLMELGDKLIRSSSRAAGHAEPLISAFEQGVVLGFFRLAKIDISSALEGVGFWRRCELASIHQMGIDRGQRIRAQDDRRPGR